MIKFEKKDEPPKQVKHKGENRFDQIKETAIAKRKDPETAPQSNDLLSGKSKES